MAKSPFFQLIKVATCSVLTLQLLLYQFILAFQQPPTPLSFSSSTPNPHHDHLTALWVTLLFIVVISCNGVALYAALVQRRRGQTTAGSSKALRCYLHLYLLVVCPTSALVALLKIFSAAVHLRGLAIFALVTNSLAMPLLYVLERLLAKNDKAVVMKEMNEVVRNEDMDEDRRPFTKET